MEAGPAQRGCDPEVPAAIEVQNKSRVREQLRRFPPLGKEAAKHI